MTWLCVSVAPFGIGKRGGVKLAIGPRQGFVMAVSLVASILRFPASGVHARMRHRSEDRPLAIPGGSSMFRAERNGTN